MSLYDPNVPTGLINLDIDYQNLQNNFSQLDTTFGIDHYKFSDQTANNGFHNTVTQPLIVGAAHPATAADVPKIYTMKDGTNGATIQYSRGGSNAVPSPITTIQSAAAPFNMAPSSNVNIYDFTGITRAIAQFFVSGITARLIIGVFWDGANFTFIDNPGSSFMLTSSGNILRLTTSVGTTVNNIVWTLQLIRVQT